MSSTYYHVVPQCRFTEGKMLVHSNGTTVKLVSLGEQCMDYMFNFFCRFEHFQKKSWERKITLGMVTLGAMYCEYVMHQAHHTFPQQPWSLDCAQLTVSVRCLPTVTSGKTQLGQLELLTHPAAQVAKLASEPGMSTCKARALFMR